MRLKWDWECRTAVASPVLVQRPVHSAEFVIRNATAYRVRYAVSNMVCVRELTQAHSAKRSIICGNAPTMSLTITDPETERLARLLAEETGEPVAAAIQKSLQERLDRLPPRNRGEVSVERLLEIASEVSKLPRLDNRTADEILGYDENGLPR